MPEPNKADDAGDPIARGMSLLRAGRPRDAVRLLAPLAGAPGAAAGLLLAYARALGMLGIHDQSASAYSSVLGKDPGNKAALTERAVMLSRLGQFEEALASVRAARRLAAWDGAAVFQEADLLVELRRVSEAAELLRSFEHSAPVSERTSLNAARLCLARLRLVPAIGDPDAELVRALDFARDERLPAGLRASLAARAGGVLDQLGRVDDAIGAFKGSKKVRNQPWNAELHTERIRSCMTAWTSPEADKLPVSTVDGSGMVFIVGMPRSGSSLLEQMLARHPQVQPLGERNDIIRAAAYIEPNKPGLMPLVTDLTRFTAERCEEVSQQNNALIESIQESGSVILTDKQPFNYAHVPMLARLVPGCRVLHTLRDPRDTCVSYFMQWFLSPHGQTNTFDDLGRYYRDYREMMDAWKALEAPARRPEMFEVVYEQLVSEPERVLTEVAEFIGLKYDAQMLEHTQSDRVVNTASREQVRRSLYTTSVGRWKRYADHLGPLIEHIGPYCNDETPG